MSILAASTILPVDVEESLSDLINDIGAET